MSQTTLGRTFKVENHIGEHECRIPVVLVTNSLIPDDPILHVDVIHGRECSGVPQVGHDDGWAWHAESGRRVLVAKQDVPDQTSAAKIGCSKRSCTSTTGC